MEWTECLSEGEYPGEYLGDKPGLDTPSKALPCPERESGEGGAAAAASASFNTESSSRVLIQLELNDSSMPLPELRSFRGRGGRFDFLEVSVVDLGIMSFLGASFKFEPEKLLARRKSLAVT